MGRADRHRWRRNHRGSAPCRINGPYPDKHCTPGRVFTVTAKTVCKTGYSSRVRNVSSATKRRVFARYGITSHNGSSYEVDHFIPLELGGSNALSNLFPAHAFRPGRRLDGRADPA